MSVKAETDEVKEMAGVRVSQGEKPAWVRVAERVDDLSLVISNTFGDKDCCLTPKEARRLADKLVAVAVRVEARTADK